MKYVIKLMVKCNPLQYIPYFFEKCLHLKCAGVTNFRGQNKLWIFKSCLNAVIPKAPFRAL